MNETTILSGPRKMPEKLLLPCQFLLNEKAISIAASNSSPNSYFTGYSAHHETVKPGDLFVAAEYPGYEGSSKVAALINRGISGVVLRRDKDISKELPTSLQVFWCDDTLDAYRSIASVWRDLVDIPIVAVAGSVGKSTTTSLLANILGKQEEILATQQNENGFVGIPYTLERLNANHRMAVIEIGIDAVGSMKKHDKVVRPTAAIITNTGAEHLRGLQTIDQAASEELCLFKSVSDRLGLLFVNVDDAYIEKTARLFHSTKFFYSMRREALDLFEDCTEKNTLIGQFEGPGTLRVSGLGVANALLKFSLPGEHNHQNVLAAACVGLAFGRSIEVINERLPDTKPLPGRCNFVEIGAYTLILDHYNAQPQSVRAALNLLVSLDKTGQRSACLGDVDDLGDYEATYHQELASDLAKLDLDRLLLIGPSMKITSDALHESGKINSCHWFATKEDFIARASAYFPSSGTVLVKGNFRMRMKDVADWVVDHCKRNHLSLNDEG